MGVLLIQRLQMCGDGDPTLDELMAELVRWERPEDVVRALAVAMGGAHSVLDALSSQIEGQPRSRSNHPKTGGVYVYHLLREAATALRDDAAKAGAA